MLSYNYGDWVFWETYSPPEFFGPQKVTFDGPNRLILINQGETNIDFKEDVYSAWKEWLRHPHHQENGGYAPAISVIGGDPLPGSRQLGTTYFLINGWRMRTWEGNHELTVNGNVFTREGVPVFVPTLNPWTITINLTTSTLVETVVPETSLSIGDINTISSNVRIEMDSNSTKLSEITSNISTLISSVNAIPSAVRTELTPELMKIMMLESGLTLTQATMLSEIYALYGLDPTKPLTVTNTSRVAGNGANSITQTIDTNASRTIVTRT